MPVRVDLSKKRRRAHPGSLLYIKRVKRLKAAGLSDSEASEMALGVPLKNRAVIAAMRKRRSEIKDLRDTFKLTYEDAVRKAQHAAFLRHLTFPGPILTAILQEASEEYELT